jgi:hypothetical protein
MLFGNEHEDFLYHYTSHSTLYNMVESGVVWASNAYYMNDLNEVKYAFDMFTHIVLNNIHTRRNKNLKYLLREIPEWVDDLLISPFNVFCFSLSEHGNLLSQWRAYTPHGTGVSIGLRKSDIKKYAEDNSLLFFKCCYDKKEQELLMQKVFDQIVRSFRREFKAQKNEITYNEAIDFLEKFKSRLVREAIKIKDPAFYEECEWRLVSILNEDSDVKINFRPGKTTLIPFVEFELKKFREDNWLFDHVYVGPSPNFRLSYHAISEYIFQSGACQEIINANQPYREL